MQARTPKSSWASRIAILALALPLASCFFDKSYKIGGMVSGMAGTGLVLQNNGGDNLGIPANGAFTFSKEVKKGKSYNVTVFVQPSGQPCAVSNGTGTATSNVANVAVNCGGFTVGGTVSDLTGTGLVLQNNGGNNLPVSASGAFTFSTPIASGGAYSVTVLSQPSGQSCTVKNGNGTVTANVTNVAISCASTAFTVGGTVSGLTGTGLVLRNNGGNDLSISADGAFAFSTPVTAGGTYSVTVLTQPTGQGCAVANGTGTIAGANVSNVAVTCAAPPGAPSVSLSFGVKELQFSWSAVSGAAFYRVLENPDGVSGYNLVANNITATSYKLTIPVHRRLNALYIVEACNVGGCTGSNLQGLGTDLVPLIGYAKASNTGGSGSFTSPGDQFGTSVAVSGDGNTLAVGAPTEDSNGSSPGDNSATDAGAVYVFAKVAGSWTQQAYVKASNAAASDFFGISVALSGDGNTLAVGALNQAGSGAAYVFTRTGGSWSEQALVKASNAEAGTLFGKILALSGDGNTLAVGSPFEKSAATGVGGNQINDCNSGTPTNCAMYSGAVYVFARSGNAWTQQAYVKASNTGLVDLFGTSVALNGDGSTLAVGAPFEKSAATGVGGNQTNDCNSGSPTNCAMYSGAAYVFALSSGAWSQQAYVKASNTAASDNFGNSVAVSGDGNTLAVGAPFGASNNGAAYVFARSGGAWSQQALVNASNPGASDQFGGSVALSGDGNSLAVGAPFEDSGSIGIGSAFDESAADAGAVYFYSRGAGAWSQQAYVKASNTRGNDQFGTSVALSDDGNALLVGAKLEDGGSTGIGGTPANGAVPDAANSGAAYLY
jgi:hypothetical protein